MILYASGKINKTDGFFAKKVYKNTYHCECCGNRKAEVEYTRKTINTSFGPDDYKYKILKCTLYDKRKRNGPTLK